MCCEEGQRPDSSGMTCGHPYAMYILDLIYCVLFEILDIHVYRPI